MSIAKKIGKIEKIFNLVQNKQYLICCCIYLNIMDGILSLIRCVVKIVVGKSSSPKKTFFIKTFIIKVKNNNFFTR